jgi:transposase
MKRLRIHSQERLEGKIFISMIALIINSYIHKVMIANKLYDKYTMTELLEEVNKIEHFYCGEQKTMSPVSSTNKYILKSFGIDFDKI